MSAPDEFDPFIERLFRETPPMPDPAGFARRVETRLATGSRMRTVVIGLAGLIGGVVAVRETLGANLNFSAGNDAAATGFSATAASAPDSVRLMDAGVGALTAQAQAAQSGLSALGVDFDFAGLGGMQVFWAVAALLIAAAVMAGMKLANEV
ncbi:MAG: hypothetical protein ACK4FB_05470 [Brevundimonas sp.]|uniref:hypothetical protein n=1 Tax=Brevundimonas sp. TaxID=1871086 RepID=UPI003918B4C3